MRKYKFFSVYLILCLALAVFTGGTFQSCASQATPGGGPKDTVAPVMDTSFPANFSTYFDANEIQLVFDEYINLKSPSQQISISPPLKNKPDIRLNKKVVTIRISDTLLENTTYTINFGSAITDFTEGNVNDRLKYVFSTGSFIDSLVVRGSIVNSYDQKPQKDLLVALYYLDEQKVWDSIPYKDLPTYYTYTDENGQFELENLKHGDFQLLAFDDQRGDFLLNSGRELMAYCKDTIQTDRDTNYLLQSFQPDPKFKFFGARQKSNGKIQFAFNKPVKDVAIRRYSGEKGKKAFETLTFNDARDTVNYWFEDTDRDSLEFLVSVPSRDLEDTVKVLLFEQSSQKLSLRSDVREIRSGDTIEVRANIPLKEIRKDSVYLYNSQDSLAFEIYQENLVQDRFYIIPTKAKGGDYKLKLDQGAGLGYFDQQNDSAIFAFSVLSKSELGRLDFRITGDSSQAYIFQLYETEGEVLLERRFSGSTIIEMKNWKPKAYKGLLIFDEDKNNKWTTGDYHETLQPEKIIRYPEAIEIRANWDLELEWLVDR